MTAKKPRKKSVGIAGAGLMGRLLGLELIRRNWSVSFFDADEIEGRASCAWVGAGMLAPWCELEHSSPEIAAEGMRSVSLWVEILDRLGVPELMWHRGSLVVAHPTDAGELDRLRRRVVRQANAREVMREVHPEEIEPALGSRFSSGLFFPHESWLEAEELLARLADYLRPRVSWHASTHVETLRPGNLIADGVERTFDWVVDCRGLGAQSDLPDLRGVRGELIHLHAPQVELTRPVRVMHPRYPIYVVPRPDHHFIVGATQIESAHAGPIRVRSGLELLSAAYSLHPGFAEAEWIESRVGCRPAFPDNHPRLEMEPGWVSINGLFRHGYLLGPVLAAKAADQMEIADNSVGQT